MARCFAAAAGLRHTGADIPIAWWKFMRAVAQERPDAAVLGDAALELHRRARFIGMDELTAMHLIRRAPVGSPVPDDAQRAVSDNPSSVLRALVAHAVAESGDVTSAVALLGPPPDPRGRNYASRAGACLGWPCSPWPETEPPWARASPGMTVMDLDPDEVVTYGSIDCLGSVDYFLALADEALGDREGARCIPAPHWPSTGGSGTAPGSPGRGAGPRPRARPRRGLGPFPRLRSRRWSAESGRLAATPRLGGIPHQLPGRTPS